MCERAGWGGATIGIVTHSARRVCGWTKAGIAEGDCRLEAFCDVMKDFHRGVNYLTLRYAHPCY